MPGWTAGRAVGRRAGVFAIFTSFRTCLAGLAKVGGGRVGELPLASILSEVHLAAPDTKLG